MYLKPLLYSRTLYHLGLGKAMNITSARYANAEGGILLERDGLPDLYIDKGGLYDRAVSGEFGPVAEYIAPPEPEPQPDLVPQVVSRFQARAALHQAGLLQQAQDAIAAADPIAQLAWEDATTFKRSSPTVAAIAGALSLSDTAVDDLFRAAAQIEA